MATESTSIESLPNELLLEILLHLSTIRSSETQSVAFKQKDVEKRRQRENKQRQIALHALCLTSHHFSRLATPILYASFTGSTTRHGIEPLRLFHRTIAKPQGTNKNGFTYAQYLHYVENRLADYLGNDLFSDIMDSDTADMVPEYFHLLAEIVNSAPKIQHLSVVSLENEDVSFWRHVLREQQNQVTPSFAFVAEHGFRNLEVLCAQTNIAASESSREACFRSICSAVALLPCLSDFRASGVVMSELVGPEVNIGFFKTLQRIEITECVIEIRLVAEILLACKRLRHIVCEWAYLDGSGETPRDLRPGLLHHVDTLETLKCDFRIIRWDLDHHELRDIGSLQPFELLEVLTISRTGFLGGSSNGSDHLGLFSKYRIVDLLPAGLRKFNLLLDEVDSEQARQALGDLLEPWSLFEACKLSTLKLVEVVITSTYHVHGVTGLVDYFAQAGVLFKVIIEP